MQRRRQKEGNEKRRGSPVGLLYKDKLRAQELLTCGVTGKMKTDEGPY